MSGSLWLRLGKNGILDAVDFRLARRLSNSTLLNSFCNYLVFRYCWVLSLSKLNGPLDKVIMLLLVILSLLILVGNVLEHLSVHSCTVGLD